LLLPNVYFQSLDRLSYAVVLLLREYLAAEIQHWQWAWNTDSLASSKDSKVPAGTSVNLSIHKTPQRPLERSVAVTHQPQTNPINPNPPAM